MAGFKNLSLSGWDIFKTIVAKRIGSSHSGFAGLICQRYSRAGNKLA
jgi:hypothetical protein